MIAFIIPAAITCGQDRSIDDLKFLIGKWETREDNDKKTWWEKSTRIIKYTLDSTTIELKAEAISSSGKKRKYAWYIHYNSNKISCQLLKIDTISN